MQLFITGSGTLIGNTLTNYFQKKNYKIISSYRSTFPKNLKYKKNVLVKKINLEKNFDVKKNFDILIHCASATPNNSDFDQIFQINRQIDNDLCNFIKNHSFIKQVIYPNYILKLVLVTSFIVGLLIKWL